MLKQSRKSFKTS